MKTLLSLTLSAVALFAFALDLHSQAPVAPATPLQILQAMKAKNQQLIEKQTQTLQKLDELEKEADQIKTLAKRT